MNMIYLITILLLSFFTFSQGANFYNNTITYGNYASVTVPPYKECQPIYDALLAQNRPWTCISSKNCRIIWVVYGNDLVLNWVDTNIYGYDFTCTLPKKDVIIPTPYTAWLYESKKNMMQFNIAMIESCQLLQAALL